MKLCAALIPSRNTVDNLTRCLRSYFNSADKPEDVEAVIKVDDDNHATLGSIPYLLTLFPNLVVVRGPRIHGYSSVPVFNMMCVLACQSVWTLTICDDSELLGKGWDTQLRGFTPPFAARPETYIEDHGTHSETYVKTSDTESEHSIGILVPRELWLDPGSAPTPGYMNRVGVPLCKTWDCNATDIWALAVARSKNWPIRTLKGITYKHNRRDDAPHRQSV